MDKKPLPPKEVLLLCMQVAGSSIEAAEYFASQFEDILKQAKLLPECNDILDKVKEYAEFVHYKLSASTEPWLGEQSYLTDFQNMQENLATAAAKKLEGAISGDIVIHIAFGPFGKMLRGYTDANGPVSAKAAAALDTLLNSWFSRQDNVSKGSRIFEADKDGEIKMNANGKEVSADSEHLKEAIKDPEAGCEAFIEEKGFSVTVQLEEYPVGQIEAERVKAAEKTVETPIAPAAKTEETIEVEPETPNVGMSSGS